MRFSSMILVISTILIAAAITLAAEKSESIKKDTVMTNSATVDYKSIPFNTIDGAPKNLKAFEGDVLLIVNVASECGYTPQYTGLEEIYRKYKDRGFTVVGFPANNFGEQEPGTNEEIKNFCSSKFHVTFPMMSKVSVAGEDAHLLFKYLTQSSSIPGEIKWNFSKFLLDRNGNLVARWPSKVEPNSSEVTAKIEELLKVQKAEKKS